MVYKFTSLPNDRTSVAGIWKLRQIVKVSLRNVGKVRDTVCTEGQVYIKIGSLYYLLVLYLLKVFQLNRCGFQRLFRFSMFGIQL